MSKSQAKETSESLNCELEQKIKKLEKEKQYLTNSNKNHNYISLTDNKTQMFIFIYLNKFLLLFFIKDQYRH